ncbi:hypothetical protein N7532_001235 [Penicillium argentinense]|uniref:Uncharacterized protein n=1 Tax=Penicillium argentinense TaxID=1131581 RepID=A0A9W9KLJ2_9EURO|nr:uncharacterized protein N7532_001235 [Penicillium argentinense]KAJ5110700.1 hypothetical protein N7532_001235 [Penicillium argentinense]
MLPIPLVLCGKAPRVAIAVRDGLRPTYEAIHIVTSVEAGIADIPSLLLGNRPQVTDPDNLGSQRYGRQPLAVIIGGGYSDADFAAMRESCHGISTVPWLRHAITTSPPPNSSKPILGPEYGKEIAERVTRCLRDLADDGKLNSDGVYYF